MLFVYLFVKQIMPLCKLHCVIYTGFAVYKSAHTGLSTPLSPELEDSRIAMQVAMILVQQLQLIISPKVRKNLSQQSPPFESAVCACNE